MHQPICANVSYPALPNRLTHPPPPYPTLPHPTPADTQLIPLVPIAQRLQNPPQVMAQAPQNPPMMAQVHQNPQPMMAQRPVRLYGDAQEPESRSYDRLTSRALSHQETDTTNPTTSAATTQTTATATMATSSTDQAKEKDKAKKENLCKTISYIVISAIVAFILGVAVSAFVIHGTPALAPSGYIEERPSPSCVKLEHHDILGNDLEMIHGNLSSCCQKCNNHPECRAYAWDDGEGGRCYLKSATNPTIVKNYVHVGILPQFRPVYKVPTIQELEKSIHGTTLFNPVIVRQFIVELRGALHTYTSIDETSRNRKSICERVTRRMGGVVGGTLGCIFGQHYIALTNPYEGLSIKFLLDHNDFVEFFFEKMN